MCSLILNVKTSPAVCHHLFASQADGSSPGFRTLSRRPGGSACFEAPWVRICQRTFLLSVAQTPRSLYCRRLFPSPLREQIKAHRKKEEKRTNKQRFIISTRCLKISLKIQHGAAETICQFSGQSNKSTETVDVTALIID